MKHIAIIGAGLAGLTAAHQLKDHAQITLFDKSRGVSGRLSTRRAEPYFFDHGAQYFTAKSQEFQTFLKPLIKDDIIAPWQARYAEIKGDQITHTEQWNTSKPHYVGVPGMNAIGKYLAQDLNAQTGIRITKMSRRENKWHLYSEDNQEFKNFDWVIVTTPVSQALDILPQDFEHRQSLQSITMKACYALMLGFEEGLSLNYDCARIHGSDLGWIAVNSSKPGRNGGYSLLIQSTNDWADQHIDDNRDEVMENLINKTSDLIGHDVSKATHKALHGWRFAFAEKSSNQTHYIDNKNALAVCGDWCIEGRVEAAFSSGKSCAEALQNLI